MELDREALMQLIDSRVALGIEKWYQMYIIPLHNEDKQAAKDFRAEFSTKLDTLYDAYNQGKGAYWLGGIGGIIILALLNHYWVR